MKQKPEVDKLIQILRKKGDLKIKQVNGKPVAELTTVDGTFNLAVPSKQFVEIVDEIVKEEKLPISTQDTILQLTNIISAMSDQDDDDDDDVPMNLNEYIITDDPGYISRNFEGTTDLAIIERAAAKRKSVLLEGASGAGKSMVLQQLAFKTHMPYVSIDLSEGFDADMLLGTYHKEGMSWKWRDGSLITLMKLGGILILQELNSARSETLSRFHELLERQRTLTLIEHKSEVIKAHRNFFIAATQNTMGDSGTHPLPSRLRERFQVIMTYGYDNETEAKLKGADAPLLWTFQMLRQNKTVKTPCSTRMLCTFIENRAIYGDKIAVNLLLNVFKPAERESVVSAFKSAYEKAQDMLHSEIPVAEEVGKSLLMQPAR